jgi:hypothetical protein
MQNNQLVTFLSDRGDTVRDLQLFLNPEAEHLLLGTMNGSQANDFTDSSYLIRSNSSAAGRESWTSSSSKVALFLSHPRYKSQKYVFLFPFSL